MGFMKVLSDIGLIASLKLTTIVVGDDVTIAELAGETPVTSREAIESKRRDSSVSKRNLESCGRRRFDRFAVFMVLELDGLEATFPA